MDETIPHKAINKKSAVYISIIVLMFAVIIFLLVKNNFQTEKPFSENSSPAKSGEQENLPGQDEVITPEEIDNLPAASLDVEDTGLTRIYLDEKYQLGQLRLTAPGANPVTYDERVVNYQGQEVKNDAPPMSDSAPRQSDLLNKQNMPDYIFQMNISDGKFSPNVFTTKAGGVTTFSLTSLDVYAHNLVFDDEKLSGVFMFVGPSQTRAITFKAPDEPGEYVFRCASGEHSASEVGKMIVVK